MTTRSLTIEIPQALYDRLQQRASRSRRTVEAEVLDALVMVMHEDEGLPDELAAAIAPLADLDDEALRQAARTHLPDEVVAEMEDLHARRDQDGLTPDEANRLAELLRAYDRVMLVRAQAAALLKERGYDVRALLQQA